MMGTLGISFSWNGNGDPDCSPMVQTQNLHPNISDSFLFPLQGRPGSLSSDVSSLIITITEHKGLGMTPLGGFK